MKRAFTIVEVSILCVIFLIVAFLIAPLSLDDTMQAKNASRWRNVQTDFINISESVNNQREELGESFDFKTVIKQIINNETKNEILPYKISYMNGVSSNKKLPFNHFRTTYSNATIAVELYEQPQNEKYGEILYDVNGTTGPNIWGKDVFGLDITEQGFKPYCKMEPLHIQKRDCSKNGSGLCCSNYYLIGGNFD